MKKVIIRIGSAAVSAALILALVFVAQSVYPWAKMLIVGPYPGDVIERWEVANEKFKLRIERRPEMNTWMGGNFYSYQYIESSNDEWKELFTQRRDDPNPIEHDRILMINERVGFAYDIKKLAVTTDSGKTWSIWDINAANETQHFCTDTAYIEFIKIDSDSTGQMRLSCYTYKTEPHYKFLKTNDFGKNWEIDNSMRDEKIRIR